MDIIKFAKSTAPIEEREEFIFKLVDSLDVESINLFNDTTSLSSEAYYNIDSIIKRSHELNRIYMSVLEAYEYINNIELSSYVYAARRFQLKRMLTAIATLYAFMVNGFFGLFTFVLLNQKASNDFCKELENIYDIIEQFDFEKLEKVSVTLDNCARILCRKKQIISDSESINGNIVNEANSFISLYLEDYVSLDDLKYLSDDVKLEIINILKNQFDSEIDDIGELLNIAKKKYDDGLKLIKEY